MRVFDQSPTPNLPLRRGWILKKDGHGTVIELCSRGEVARFVRGELQNSVLRVRRDGFLVHGRTDARRRKRAGLRPRRAVAAVRALGSQRRVPRRAVAEDGRARPSRHARAGGVRRLRFRLRHRRHRDGGDRPRRLQCLLRHAQLLLCRRHPRQVCLRGGQARLAAADGGGKESPLRLPHRAPLRLRCRRNPHPRGAQRRPLGAERREIGDHPAHGRRCRHRLRQDRSGCRRPRRLGVSRSPSTRRASPAIPIPTWGARHRARLDVPRRRRDPARQPDRSRERRASRGSCKPSTTRAR